MSRFGGGKLYNHTDTNCNTCSRSTLAGNGSTKTGNKFIKSVSDRVSDIGNFVTNHSNPSQLEDWTTVLRKSASLLYKSIIEAYEGIGNLAMGTGETIVDLVEIMAQAATGEYSVTTAGKKEITTLIANIKLTALSEPSAAIYKTTEYAIAGATPVPQKVLDILAKLSVPSDILAEISGTST